MRVPREEDSVMISTAAIDRYRHATGPSPTPNLGWNVYGTGIEAVGRDGRPEPIELPTPAPDQLLVRVDAVGLCYSDVKLIRQGGDHPKLYGRDLAKHPTRLGHEVAVTVIEAGTDLRDRYPPGLRLAVQPDIHIEGRSTAYGYTIPGGLVQYHLVGSEILDGDDGAYVIPVDDSLGYGAAALSEPWACVEAAYTQRRRLSPLEGGIMWIVGHPDDPASYEFSRGLDEPDLIVLTDVPSGLLALVEELKKPTARVQVRDTDDYPALSQELTGGNGFDDIVVLDPHSAEQMAEIAGHIAFRGTLNLVGSKPLDGPVSVDLGRIHYHYTAYLGNPGPDIAASYGEARNRCELQPRGVAVFVGAGGPMGQMHIQRALELDEGPRTLVAVDRDQGRLTILMERLAPLAAAKGRQLLAVDSSADPGRATEAIRDATDGRGADDVIVTVPMAAVMAEASSLMAPDGMLVLFAGVPNGTFGPLDLSEVYLHGAQFTGTSGSRIVDQQRVLDKAAKGKLSLEASLAAVGGIEAARDGLEALMDGRFAGKIVIFPQLTGLPLLELAELADRYPSIGALMDNGDSWTRAAEAELFETFWKR